MLEILISTEQIHEQIANYEMIWTITFDIWIVSTMIDGVKTIYLISLCVIIIIKYILEISVNLSINSFLTDFDDFEKYYKKYRFEQFFLLYAIVHQFYFSI